ENALDADATQIRVELREGGARLIRVSDDGTGIAASDLDLVCQPHTTSKISRFEDVARLMTLGFRGEALSSVAAVADVEIASADGDRGVGASFELSRAGNFERRLVARERGTTVTARHLFQSVPARLALLGTSAAERARCLAAIRLYACANATIRFTVIAEGEVALHTPGTGLPGALTALYGADLAAGMIPFAATTVGGMATLGGQLSSRAFTYTTRDQMALTVNGRLVTNRALLAAAERGYRPLLRKGRHPVLLCHLTVPGEWVDVNVHPAKAEVLLRHETEIARALREAIHAALGAAPAAAIKAPAPYAARFHVQPTLRFPARRRTSGQPFAVSVSRLRERTATYGATGVAAPITALAQLNDALILARGADGALYLVDQH
ncbi:MAG: DNA mismatch repair endonuclease MutL, partial [Ktedonobacterales bacterium]